MTNIAKLLKDCPKGTKLYSPLFGEVEYMQLGDNDKIWIKVDNSEPFDKYGRYFGSHFRDAECLLFPSKNCRTWEGWTPPVEPKFKVGSWLYHNSNGVRPVLVTDYDERHGYQIQDENCRYHLSRNFTENEYHLWTIADAKDGDVLSVEWNEEDGHIKKDGSTKFEKIVIFKSVSKHGVEGYGCTFVNGKLAFSDVEVPYYSKTWTNTLKPATKEQRDLLFAKMQEAGYEWDADKKELRKIQPHCDIANFKAGMPVLVRDDNGDEWNYLLFSHYRKKLSDHFSAGGNPWFQCIPYNDDTKHLLGTTDMPSEEYINW